MPKVKPTRPYRTNFALTYRASMNIAHLPAYKDSFLSRRRGQEFQLQVVQQQHHTKRFGKVVKHLASEDLLVQNFRLV